MKNKSNNITGFLYFYIHMITEIICFYYLALVTGSSAILWLIPLIYDALAFVPQSIIGVISEKYKINLSLFGIALMGIGLVLSNVFNLSLFISVIFIGLGNACVHINGAEVTLNTSGGKLTSPAIFVSGGSFGVILGKILGSINTPYYLLLLLLLTTVPFILLANDYDHYKKNCKEFNYHNKSMNPYIVIILSILVVSIRGYMGYGIPTSWNKTIGLSIYLYFIMGLGKALGGILIDKIGIKKTSYISVIGGLPLLLLGDNHMIISLIGVMFFSMTMAVTLALLVSSLKRSPGLAFGLTTIGLFLGSLPIFFFKITSILLNDIVIILLSFVCIIFLNLIIKEDDHDKKRV